MLYLVIDNIIFYLQKSGGISVVWYELASRLLKENIFLLKFLEYNINPQNIFYDKLKLSNKQKLFTRIFCLKLQRYLPVKLPYMDAPFIFHSTYYRYSTNSQAINITTVHDFTYEYYSYGLAKWLHCWQKYKAIRHSDYIICISENTKKDLMKFLPDIDERKISVIYNGVSNDYFPLTDCALSDLPFPKNEYLLFVGARSGYKNFEFVIEALKEIKTKALVIVGSPLTRKETKELELKIGSGRYVYTGRVTNAKLNILYNNAYALLYPSYYEGFGIPVLEAQKAACPVIAYNSSSIAEIMGDSPLKLDELTVDNVKKCFRLLDDETIRNEIIAAGLENARKYTWDKMYDQVKELYQIALNKSKRQ